MAGLHANDVWGGSYFTSKMKELAVRCGFSNPTRCTGQGKRAEGISRMVNSKEFIPLCESMRVARHDSVDAHLGYAEPDDEAHDKRYRAMASKTVSKCDDDRKVRSSIYFYHFVLILFIVINSFFNLDDCKRVERINGEGECGSEC